MVISSENDFVAKKIMPKVLKCEYDCKQFSACCAVVFLCAVLPSTFEKKAIGLSTPLIT